MRAALVLTIVMTLGCYATTGGMRAKRDDPKSGETRELVGPCKRHMAVAKRTIKQLKLDVLSTDTDTGEILARRGMAADEGFMGDRVALWFDPVRNNTACTVHIYSRGQDAFGGGLSDHWPKIIFRQMKLLRDADETNGAAEAE